MVELTLIDELEVAEHLDGAHLAHLEGAGADLHDVEGIVVARRAVEAPGQQLLGRVLPGLRQHAIVEERRAVRVVAQGALLGVLHDRVVRQLLVHLELGGDAGGDLTHKVDEAAARRAARGVEGQVVPWRERREAIRLNEARSEGDLAKGLLSHGTQVGRDAEATEDLRVGHPVAGLLPLVVVRDDLPPLVHHEAGRDALGGEEVRGDSGAARLGAEGGELAHLGARDRDEVVGARLVLVPHGVVLLVVVDLGEAEKLHGALARRGHEHVTAVVRVVDVVPIVRARRVGHARRVATHREEGGAGDAAALGVELHLRGSGVDHGRGPDGHDRPVRVELARRHHLVVLLDADVQRHVGGLGPAAQRREPEHGVLVAARHQLAARVLHEEGVAGVRGVARLERIDHIGTLLDEGRLELVDGQPVLVEAIVVLDAAEELDLAAQAVGLAGGEHVLDVRVLVVLRAPRAVDDLPRAVLVGLGRAQDGERGARRARQGDRLGVADLAAREVGDGEEDRHRHRDTLAREAVLHPVGRLAI
mmetsp:Transcript_28769/g.67857  ORF Transcript_28769/g.67857 Transcript_28769/m.67857 type:complete len:533 (-) Transcript_28769:1408-3006(-)